jgi:hypothetical protein
VKICRYGEGRYGLVRDGNVYDVTEYVQQAANSTRLHKGDAAIAIRRSSARRR